MMRWKAKVASSLTNVRKQLFEQQDVTVICTIYFHPWLHENHTSVSALGQEHDTKKLKLGKKSLNTNVFLQQLL